MTLDESTRELHQAVHDARARGILSAAIISAALACPIQDSDAESFDSIDSFDAGDSDGYEYLTEENEQ